MSEAYKIDIHTEFTSLHCCNCHIPFAVPEKIRQRWKNEGKTFYCPNGHPQSYSESTVDKLKKQNETLKRQKDFTESCLQDACKREKKLGNKLRGEKAAKTRIKNRIKNGVCPCCNRTFKNLQRHMTTQHKDYVKNKK